MRIALFGATGTIGQASARALLSQGHEVICPVRARTVGPRGSHGAANPNIQEMLAGATLHWGGPEDMLGAQSTLFQREPIDAVVSCLASRTGRPRDAWAVDYQMHADILRMARLHDVKHFVLLSAICVQKPLLEFQHAKLAFEKLLVESGMRYSIVRPTAFFKSLSGQVQRLRQGKPYLMFGDGQLTACKPISDQDLASFIAECLTDPAKHYRILPVGGPGEAITPLAQGTYLFERLAMRPRFRKVPLRVIDGIIRGLSFAGHVIPSLADKAELARIGRYYATESMLVWDAERQIYDASATPSYGTMTLFEHYDQLIEGGGRVDLGDHAVF